MTTASKILLSFALFCLPLTLHAQWDADAQDFFDRAEALDAEVFDLTASKPWANKQYVKAQWNDFVVGLKADNAWDDITEWVPLFGLNWVNSGALPKLKYDTTETVAYESNPSGGGKWDTGLDSWAAFGSATAAGNIDSAGPAGDLRDDCARYTASSTPGAQGISRSGSLAVGRYYRITVDVYIPSSNSDVSGVKLQDGANGISAVYDNIDGAWTTVELSGLPTHTQIKIHARGASGNTINDPGADDVIYFRNVVFTQLSPATVINSGFVTGDYDPIVGLTGDGTSYLDSGYWFPNFDGDDLHFGAQIVTPESVAATTAAYLSTFDAGYPGSWGILNIGSSLSTAGLVFSADAVEDTSRSPGHFVASVRSRNDAEGYLDGSSVDTDTARSAWNTANASANLGILARIRDDSTVDIHSDATLSHVHYGTGVTTAQALAISTRINTLEQSITAGQTMTVSGATSHKLAKRLPAPCIDYGFQGNHADRITANATVHTVTNLNASGAGSYLQAVEDANNDGTPSIIKFTVSGRIDLLVNVSVYGRLFVDGTTAPDPGICISGGMHFLQRTNFTEPSDNVFFQDIAFYPSTRFSGGIIDDFVDQGGGLWKSTNPVFARVQLVEFVFEGDHPGAYTNGPPGNLITQAGSYPPAAGQAYLDAAADEFWVAEGGDISTDPNSDPIIIKLLKTNHPNAAQVLDVENVVFLRCTFARTTDIAVLADNVRNFAMVDCIIADPIGHTYHQKGPHSKGPLFKVDDTDEPLWSNNILVYRNLAMHGRERMPCRFADAEGWIINNVGYGMVAGFEIATRDTDIPGWQQSVVGNYLIEATNTAERVPDIVIEPSGNGSVYLDATNYWGGQVRTSPWIEGAAPNYLDHRNALSDNNSDVDAGDRLSAPHDQLPLGLTPTSAADAYTYTTTGLVGARYDRDYWQGEVANFDGTTQIKCDWRTDKPFVHMQEVLSDGVTLRLHFSESMTAGAGGTGGMTLYNYTATYSSGSGTDTWDYTITGGPIGKGVDGLATTYLQPGDGIETTTGGTDVQRWIRYLVNNNSTQ